MRKRSLSVLALVIAILITTYFIVTVWGTTTSNENVSGRGTTDVFPTCDDTAFGGLFAQPAPVNDSLPHYLYQRLTDSIKRVNEDRQLENRSVSKEGWAYGSLGMYTLRTPETRYEEKVRFKQITDLLDSLTIAADKKIATLTNKDSIQRIKDLLRDTLDYFNRTGNKPRIENAPKDLHYLSLQGYSLPKETKFFIQNGTYNLAYLKVDSVKKSHDETWRYGHYERKQIRIRYSAEEMLLLIPVSAQLYKVLSIAGLFASCFLVAAGIYFFLGFPLQILINISRGRAFDDKNVRRLNLMALVLLILTLGSILSPYILRLCFWKMIPNDFIFPGIWSKVNDRFELFIAVVVLFITGKAFQKGNKLQKEQDLTI